MKQQKSSCDVRWNQIQIVEKGSEHFGHIAKCVVDADIVAGPLATTRTYKLQIEL